MNNFKWTNLHNCHQLRFSLLPGKFITDINEIELKLFPLKCVFEAITTVSNYIRLKMPYFSMKLQNRFLDDKNCRKSREANLQRQRGHLKHIYRFALHKCFAFIASVKDNWFSRFEHLKLKNRVPHWMNDSKLRMRSFLILQIGRERDVFQSMLQHWPNIVVFPWMDVRLRWI